MVGRKTLGRAASPNIGVRKPARADCSSQAICVTSLNMRKWMKDRLQPRKKKAREQGSQPAPPPLQPAYFDAEQVSAPVSESLDRETGHPESGHDSDALSAPEAELEAQPVREEPANTAE